MKRKTGEMKRYQVEFTDSRTGATSPIDTVKRAEGYTAADYMREAEENADSMYIEMLKTGNITIIEA